MNLSDRAAAAAAVLRARQRDASAEAADLSRLRRTHPCPRCDGSGDSDPLFSDPGNCPDCDGRGYQLPVSGSPSGS